MKCWRCGGAMDEQRVTFCACTVTPPVVVRDVPATVCGQCGERTYSTSVLQTLKRIRDGDGPTPVLAYSYAYEYDEASQNRRVTPHGSALVPSFYVRSPGTTGTTFNVSSTTTLI